MPRAETQDSLFSAARRHWRRFLPIWLFPAALLGFTQLPVSSTLFVVIFFVLMLPIFFVCIHIAVGPRRQGQATFVQTAFWAVLAPFLVWAVLVMSIFGLAFALRAT